MRKDVEDIRKLIKSRYNHFGKELSENKLNSLCNHYAETNMNLLYIKAAIDEKILNENEEKARVFDSEEIGDHIAFLQLKQLDIDDAEKVLKAAAKKLSRLSDAPEAKPNRAFSREHHIKFSSDEIGDHLAYLQLNQTNIDNAERALKFYVSQNRH